MKKFRGFTLIELITVIAITAILLTIIAVPIIQGFNLTRAAQGFADAQDRARTLIRRLEAEIGNGAAVRDNGGERGAVDVVVPGQNLNTFELVRLPFTKIDIVSPAQGDPARGPSGAFINPDTGKEDPTLVTPKGQYNLPARAGSSITRYFVGLREPVVDVDGDGVPERPGTYNNPYDGLLLERNSRQDNLFVLYRVEFQPKVWRRVNNELRFVVNTDLFLDADNDGEPDDLDDPAFFTLLPGAEADYQTGALTQRGLDKAARIKQWLRRAVVVTETSRYDMIAPALASAGKVIYDNNRPRLVPLVRFQPVRVTSEPAVGQLTSRTGEEAFNIEKAGPDVYTTQYGSWSNLFMRLWPSVLPSQYNPPPNGPTAGDVRLRWDSGDPYLVARTWKDSGRERFSIFGYDRNTMASEEEGIELFDVTRYVQIAALPKSQGFSNSFNRPYAFTQAILDADQRSGWLGARNPDWRRMFVPVVPEPRSGKVTASFPIQEVGSDPTVPYNLRVPTYAQESAQNAGDPSLGTGVRVSPFNDNGAPQDFTPNNDPDVNTGNWNDEVFRPVNRRFNKLWRDWPTLAPGLDRTQYVKRYIDLRLASQADGSAGPLDPRTGLARAFVTPGSEEVVGPDQRPGPNYGRYVRYQRSATRPVGPNQYYINYTDQPEPDWQRAGITVPPYDPLSYDPDNFVQAVLQAPYRAGYLELNSRFGEPIPSAFGDNGGFVPTGNIYVSYRFQYTEPNDVLAVDYDSSQVLEVTLTIKNYPQVQNIPNPQTITVRGSSEVRNFIR